MAENITLYHYFERAQGPFKSLSDLPLAQAQQVLDSLKAEGLSFASGRPDGYLARRRELEQQVRSLFIAKGGKPLRKTPHYFVVEACPWLETWYRDPAFVALPLGAVEASAVSFTYGDMFPTFSPRVQDGREYRRTVYTYPEILRLIQKYGLPQCWNAHGEHGPERYVEAHVWRDLPHQLFSAPLP